MAFTKRRQLSMQQAKNGWDDNDEINWDDEIESDLNYDTHNEFYEKSLSEIENQKKVIVYQKKKNTCILPSIETNFVSRNELDDFTNKHTNDVFLKNLSHALSKKHLKGSITELPFLLENFEEKKKALIINLKEINTRLDVREKDKSEKEDEKIKLNADFDKQFVGKSKRELLMLDKSALEKQKNKKIIEINNFIGRIDTAIIQLKIDIDEIQKKIDVIDNELISLTKRKTKLDREIMKIDKKFHNEMIIFEKEFEIKFDEFAKSRGWHIIRYKYNCYGAGSTLVKENTKIDMTKQLEVIEKSDDEDIDEPSSPSKIEGFGFTKMVKPIPPTISKPIRNAIVPIVCQPNFGCKPCKDGNICTRKNCLYLHASNHTPALGWKNKEDMERIENIRYEREYDEYERAWKKYEIDMKMFEDQDRINSVEEFPALGGGGGGGRK